MFSRHRLEALDRALYIPGSRAGATNSPAGHASDRVRFLWTSVMPTLCADNESVGLVVNAAQNGPDRMRVNGRQSRTPRCSRQESINFRPMADEQRTGLKLQGNSCRPLRAIDLECREKSPIGLAAVPPYIKKLSRGFIQLRSIWYGGRNKQVTLWFRCVHIVAGQGASHGNCLRQSSNGKS